jgi:hypothetical protein
MAEDLGKKDFDAVKKKVVSILVDGASPAVNDVFAECDGLITSYFNDISKRVQILSEETEETTDVAVTALRELLPTAAKAMVLSSVDAIRFKPVELLTLIYETCDGIFRHLQGRVKTFLEIRFQFLAAEKEFKILMRFKVFDYDLRSFMDRLPASTSLFGERIAALKRDSIDQLTDALQWKLLVALGADSAATKASAEADDMSVKSVEESTPTPQLDDITLENLLRGVSAVVESERSSLFQDSVDFFHVKNILTNEVSKASRYLIEDVKAAIKESLKEADASNSRELRAATALLENGKRILEIASQYKFTKAGAFDMRKHLEKQEKALEARRGSLPMDSAFSFDTASIKKAHRFLQTAKEDDYQAYISLEATISAKFLEAKAQVLMLLLV